MAVRQNISPDKLRRQRIIEYQRAVDRQEGSRLARAVNDNEQDGSYDEREEVDDGQERQALEQEDVHDKMHFMLHALDVRRKHIKQAENHLEEEKSTKPTLWRYKIVFILAIAKDLLDFAGGAIPGISVLVTGMFSFAMFLALYLAKTNRSLFEIKKIATMIVGFMVEAFGFGLNLFPIQTATAVFIYLIDVVESNEKIAKAIQLIENITEMKHRK